MLLFIIIEKIEWYGKHLVCLIIFFSIVAIENLGTSLKAEQKVDKRVKVICLMVPYFNSNFFQLTLQVFHIIL